MSAISPLWIPVVATYLSIAWAVVFHRIWGWRRYHLASVDYWSYCGGFVALALMITLPLPPVMAEIDRLVGLVGLADTLANVAALLTSLTWLIYLGRLVPPDRRWLIDRRPDWWVPWRLLLVLFPVAVVVLAGRFVWAPGRLGFRLAPHPDAAMYYLTGAHLVYRGVCLLQLGLVILVLRRLAAVVGDRPALQARLRVIRWVLWYTLFYIVYESASAVAWQLPDLSSRIFRLRSLLLLAAVVAPNSWYIAGLALWRRFAATLAGLLSGWRDWRAYRRLYALWAALYPVLPSISLLPSPSRRRAWRPDRLPDRSLTFVLCRMVAEIHDWTIRLWAYQEPRAVAVAEEVAGEANLPAHARTVLVEAVAIAAALQNWQAGRLVPVVASNPQPGRVVMGGRTLGEEIASLASIADAFGRGPLVALALARLATERGVPAPAPDTQGFAGSSSGVTQHS